MQKDFHFFAIYFLLRAAGLPAPRSGRIAYASQYTDDAKEGHEFVSDRGVRLNTVHTSFSLLTTPFSPRAQREVWLPFHFVPGLEGKSKGERLVVRPDPPPCRSAMTSLRNDLGNDHKVGIFLHSWADTWAHQGFSARKGPENAAHTITFSNGPRDLGAELLSYASHYFPEWRMDDLVEVGHAKADSFPDMPFLKWGYIDGNDRVVSRDNPEIFLEAARTIYGFIREDLARGKGAPWGSLEKDVAAIIDKPGNLEERCGNWKALVGGGIWFPGEETDRSLDYDEDEWKNRVVDPFSGRIRPKLDLIRMDWFQFHLAARWYKGEILKAMPGELLGEIG